MNRCYSVTGLFLGILVRAVALDERQPAAAELRVRVTDEGGRPLSAVRVLLTTSSTWVPDARIGIRDEAETVSGRTDTNGMVVLGMPSRDGRVGCIAVPSPGFLWSRGVEYRFTNVVEGRWIPWSPEISIILKRAADSPWRRSSSGSMPLLPLPSLWSARDWNSFRMGAVSSIGRAPALHAGCRGFKSLTAHQTSGKSFQFQRIVTVSSSWK